MEFLGRSREIELLRNWEKRLPGGHLTVMYGRRRVGKTRLVREAFSERKKLMRFEGLESESTATQIRHFLDQFADQTGRPEFRSVKTSNWNEVLGYLADYIENNATPENPFIVFFDEFQWMAAERVDLVSRLKYIWDNRLQELPIHLILCGSISSFIVRKVIRSKALYGRIHLEIHLKPLTMPETRPLFAKRSLHEAVDLYLSLGGIPQYLEMVDPTKSTQLNLQDLCFSSHGFLVDEYERIFASHFGRNTHFQKILATLASKPNANREQLARLCKIGTGGSLSRYLEDLEMAEFIERYVPVGRPQDSRINRYRVSDPYLLFYFRFILPAKKEIASGRTIPLSRLMPEKKLAPWRGLAFERMCLAHHDLIAEKLGFSAVSYEAGSWFARADDQPGAQIDLLYSRADRVVSLCEVKYRNEKIGKGVIREVKAKIDTYPNPNKRLSIEPVLITASGVTDELQNEGFFTRVLNLEDLFGST